jgi:hypothetical protein
MHPDVRAGQRGDLLGRVAADVEQRQPQLVAVLLVAEPDEVAEQVLLAGDVRVQGTRLFADDLQRGLGRTSAGSARRRRARATTKV